MKHLFRERRLRFLVQSLRYLRYVLNDHFVLVLLVFLGFLTLQYRTLLEDFPDQPWGVMLALVVLSAGLFFAGRIATYLEPADEQFLLVKEKEVWQEMRVANLRASVLWCGVQVLGQVLLLPLYLKLGMNVVSFSFLLGVLTILKFVFFARKLRAFQQKGLLLWRKAIGAETKRQQLILQFFALFTTVKGITTSVKPRRYLDGLLRWGSARQGQAWDYLYLRALLRSGDFWGLYLRLTGLGVLCLLFIEVPWLAVGLTVLLDYLLVFQLLALYRVYDYQYLTMLFPLTQEVKKAGFLRTVRRFLYLSVGVHSLLGLVVLRERAFVFVLLVGGVLLGQLYLGAKTKKWIDE